MSLVRILTAVGVLAVGAALSSPAQADSYVNFGVSTGNPCCCGPAPVVVYPRAVYYPRTYYVPRRAYYPTYYPTYAYGYASPYYFSRPWASSYVGFGWSSRRHYGIHRSHGYGGRRVIGTRR